MSSIATVEKMMDSLRNNRDTAVTVLLGAAFAGSATLLTLYVSKRKLMAARRAKLQCSCGKVEVEIYQPAENYKYSETPNIQCCCNDCIGFCKAVMNEGSTDENFQKAYFDPGVPTILFYDSEISVRRGGEWIEHMKLSKKTDNRRVFAKCCGTPIAICPDRTRLNLVYCPIIRPADPKDCGANEVPFPAKVIDQPTVCLHTKNLDSAAEGEAKAKHPDMKLVSTIVAPATIAKLVGRLVLLTGMGARGPGQGFPVSEGKTIGIGYESISQQMAKK